MTHSPSGAPPTRSLRFWRWLTRNPDITRVVKVKAWLPHWDGYCGAIAWPTLLIDERGRRITITPIWDRYRIWGMLGRKDIPVRDFGAM